MHFDFLIKSGDVIDPEAGQGSFFDIGICRGLITAVDRNIPNMAVLRRIDATEKIGTPGLVDLHRHVYYNATFWGIDADTVAA